MLSFLTFIIDYCPRWLTFLLFFSGLAHVTSLVAFIADTISVGLVLIIFAISFAMLVICTVVAHLRRWWKVGRKESDQWLRREYPDYWR